MVTKLRRYQLKGVRKIERWNGVGLLADEMGLGKTVQALWWMKYYLEDGPSIVVCPAGLRWNWEAEAKKHVNVRAHVIEHLRRGKQKLPKAQLYILSYEALRSWIPYLETIGVKLIIVDECHYIMSRTALRTKAVKEFQKKIPHKIFISGTPLTNRPAELWSVLNMINPKKWPSFFAYAQRYCKPEKKPWGWQFKGATNIPELHRILKADCMVRRLKKDVLKDLPAKTRQVIPFELGTKDRNEYNKGEADFARWLANSHNYSGSRIKKVMRAKALAQMSHLKGMAGEKKIPQVIKWVEDWMAENDGKLILFGIHKRVLRPIHAHFAKTSVLVDGSVTGKHRQALVDQFQTNPKTRLFIGNIKAAGVGWNGTKATAVAFCELDWTPGAITQAEDRAHRIGQVNKVHVYFLVVKGTIEEELAKTIQKKQGTLARTLDGKNDRKERLDIFNQVLSYYREGEYRGYRQRVRLAHANRPTAPRPRHGSISAKNTRERERPVQGSLRQERHLHARKANPANERMRQRRSGVAHTIRSSSR